TTASHFDRATGVTSQAPASFGGPFISRTTVKATLNHYRPSWLNADHQWKVGAQVEQGGHHVVTVIPSGTRYVDNNGLPFQAVSRAPWQEGGEFVGAAAFASDAITIGERLTINAGVRYDYNRAYSPDLHAIDAQGRQTDEIIGGTGTLYTWNLVSP